MDEKVLLKALFVVVGVVALVYWGVPLGVLVFLACAIGLYLTDKGKL